MLKSTCKWVRQNKLDVAVWIFCISAITWALYPILADRIVAGWDLDEPTAGAAPFLDSPEMFATLWTTASVAASEDPPAAAYKTYTLTPYVDMPGSFSTAFATIEPFVDYMNDREKEYTTNAVSTEISDILIASGSFEDADTRTYDKMAPAGFVFDNNPIGIDSIAYGGLKK